MTSRTSSRELWLLSLFGVVLVVGFIVAAILFNRPAGPSGQQGASATPTSLCTDVSGPQPQDAALRGGATGQVVAQPLTAEVSRYAADAASLPPASRGTSWTTDVLGAAPALDPLFTVLNGDPTKWVTTFLATPSSEYRCVVENLRQSGIPGLTLQALEDDASALSGPPATVFLLPCPQPGGDILASETQPGAILVELWEPDPLDRSKSAVDLKNWLDGLPAVIHGDYFAVVRGDRIGTGAVSADLLASLVTDGMAASFAAHQTGHASSLDQALTPAQELALWHQLTPLLQQTDLAKNMAILSGDPPRLPRDGGRAIGYHIVQGYLKRHPDISFAALAGLDANTVFADSGYTG